jgi:hypothetical protein
MGGRFYEVEDISKIAHSATDISLRLEAMDPERREKVAGYLEEISSTLSNISIALRHKQPLDELDGMIQVHTLMFTQTVSGIVDDKLIAQFQAVLGGVSIGSHLEIMLGAPTLSQAEKEDFPEYDNLTVAERELKYGPQQMIEYRLKKLNVVSGMFKALASSIRAKA